MATENRPGWDDNSQTSHAGLSPIHKASMWIPSDRPRRVIFVRRRRAIAPRGLVRGELICGDWHALGHVMNAIPGPNSPDGLEIISSNPSRPLHLSWGQAVDATDIG
ncbi:uncharacterized protein N7459_007071 [Penicillium hispanicum]|uniref:uncharacterized protein n=1 Tax=Penicillium hispanicum TaxID=1080232 RepID=UPI0025415C95|nr:uncharacterized protein N7459_007071 [Penicillium hispanicum]KAJ5578107.1 hypothetical protein N7459_007071 [Penicillium hispanicum]